MRVVLEEGDYPVQPCHTPAESAIRDFYRYHRGLLVVPEIPGPLRSRFGKMVWLVDPALGDRLLEVDQWDMRSIFEEGRYETYDAVVIWVTPETASRIVIETHDGEGCLGRTRMECRQDESGDIYLKVHKNKTVVCDQPLRFEARPHDPGWRIISISINPEWADADRHVLYPELPGIEARYVAVETMDLPLLEESLRLVLPDIAPLGSRGIEDYLSHLSESVRERLANRWGSCGICEEEITWGHVRSCCQYLICQSCTDQLATTSCPQCRNSENSVDLVAMEGHPIPTSLIDVYRAIMQASPKARVLYGTGKCSTLGGEELAEVVSLSEVGGQLVTREPNISDRNATHVICNGPWDPYWRIRAATDQPLQLYYMGRRQQAPFRAAAEAGLLETPGTMTVVPICRYPSLKALLQSALIHYPSQCHPILEALLLRYDVVTTSGGFQDWDLDAIWSLVEDDWEGYYHKKRIRVKRVYLKHGQRWTEMIDGLPVERDTTTYIKVKGYKFDLTKLWCSVDPENRRYHLGVYSETEERHVESLDSDDDSDSD